MINEYMEIENKKYHSRSLEADYIRIVLAPSKSKANSDNKSNTNLENKSKVNLENKSKITEEFKLLKNNKIRKIKIYHNSKRFYSSQVKQNPKFNVYTELKYFLENNSINEETQIKIEEYLLNNGIDKTDMEKDIGGISGSFYSKKTSEFLIKFKPILTKKIKTFKKFKEKYKREVEHTKKAVYKLELVEIIETVGTPYVLTILLGRFIKILSNSVKKDITPQRNLVLDIIN
jgi:hypothetical protein